MKGVENIYETIFKMKGCCYWINSVFIAKLLNLPKAMINNASQSTVLKSRIKIFLILIPNLLPASPTINPLPCTLKIAWSSLTVFLLPHSSLPELPFPLLFLCSVYP